MKHFYVRQMSKGGINNSFRSILVGEKGEKGKRRDVTGLYLVTVCLKNLKKEKPYTTYTNVQKS